MCSSLYGAPGFAPHAIHLIIDDPEADVNGNRWYLLRLTLIQQSRYNSTQKGKQP